MKIAQIGVGVWGRRVLHVLSHRADITIAYIAYRGDPRTTTFLEETYPELPRTTDYRDALNDPSVEAVYIATPHSTHAPIVRDALEAKKHVLVEKPLALDPTVVQELYACAAIHNRTLMTGYLYCFDPALPSPLTFDALVAPVHIELVWKKYGTFHSPLDENLLVHDLALAFMYVENLSLMRVEKNDADVFDATWQSDRGTVHILIDRTSTDTTKKLTVTSGATVLAHDFQNQNLLSYECDAFLEATGCGASCNKKRQHIDESIAAVIAELRR
jgi:hypothetical protein